MPRRRDNDGLPKYVQRRSYGVIYTPYLGKGKKGKPVNLGPRDMPVMDVWAAYERETAEPNDTLDWLLKEYHDSKKFGALKPRTQKDYGEYREKLSAFPMANGRPFGSALLAKIKRTSIQKYLDKHHAPILANRQIQYLSAVFSWGMNRFDYITENPCLGVEKNPQTPRDRLIEPWEFESFKATALPYIKLFMELAYLCRARWSEVASLKVSDVTADGLRLTRSKGSESEITAWSARLHAVISECKKYNADAPSPISGAYLIHDKHGGRIRQNAFQSAWGRAMRKWVASGNERFTYHDIKAMGASWQEDNFAGHRSEKMKRIYMRRVKTVQPPE